MEAWRDLTTCPRIWDKFWVKCNKLLMRPILDLLITIRLFQCKCDKKTYWTQVGFQKIKINLTLFKRQSVSSLMSSYDLFSCQLQPNIYVPMLKLYVPQQNLWKWFYILYYFDTNIIVYANIFSPSIKLSKIIRFVSNPI